MALPGQHNAGHGIGDGEVDVPGIEVVNEFHRSLVIDVHGRQGRALGVELADDEARRIGGAVRALVSLGLQRRCQSCRDL